jgi:Tol biopolymer transport system component
MDVVTGQTTPLFAVEGSILGMAWLPGDVMAIVDGGTDGGNLYAVDLADGTARSLTSAITFEPDSELAVSPDGRWLAFSATTSDGTDICLASVEGGWRQLTEQGDASMPTWAPSLS